MKKMQVTKRNFNLKKKTLDFKIDAFCNFFSKKNII